MKKRFSVEQIVGVLKQAEVGVLTRPIFCTKWKEREST